MQRTVDCGFCKKSFPLEHLFMHVDPDIVYACHDCLEEHNVSEDERLHSRKEANPMSGTLLSILAKEVALPFCTPVEKERATAEMNILHYNAKTYTLEQFGDFQADRVSRAYWVGYRQACVKVQNEMKKVVKL